RIQTALHAIHGLTLLQGIFDDVVGKAVFHLLRSLTTSEPDAIQVALAYSQAFHELAIVVQSEEMSFLPDAWQAYLVNRLLDHDNPWSRSIERSGTAHISAVLRQQAERDLRTLQHLFQITADIFLHLTLDAVTPSMPALQD